jgi:hypothetical protein
MPCFAHRYKFAFGAVADVHVSALLGDCRLPSKGLTARCLVIVAEELSRLRRKA